jgi:subtilisin
MGNEFKIPAYTVHDVGDIEILSQIYPSNIRSLDIPDIWKKTKGKGIVVAILDTGTPKNHPDLLQNIDLSKCRSFIEDEDIWDIYSGHGTHVGGTISALDNTYGVVGVAPEVTVVYIKVLSKNGRSSAESVLKGLEYCIKIKPDIINMSLGASSPMPEVHNAIKKLTEMDIIVVAAAGNNGLESVLYPAQYEEVVAVGSYNNNMLKDRSSFSSYGETLDIMAPGEEILSTYLNGQYAVLSGTSMACPVVVGIVALLLSYIRSQNKSLNVEEIKKLLIRNAIDVGEKGFDKYTGWGIIDPKNIFSEISGLSFPKKLSFWQKLKLLFSK